MQANRTSLVGHPGRCSIDVTPRLRPSALHGILKIPSPISPYILSESLDALIVNLDGHIIEKATLLKSEYYTSPTANTMRYFLLLVLATIIAFATAIPITPSAPRLQKRAEQFRLQGLKEVCT
jgi:hypothetical protein